MTKGVVIGFPSKGVRVRRVVLTPGPKQSVKKAFRVVRKEESMTKHVVVMLPSGDWSVLPHRGKLEIAVVDSDAIEELKRGVDIKDIKAESKFGLYFSNASASANLATELIPEN